ncbi:hypothetical protein M153_2790006779 [Pseudoloma neurophilia]|uniref:Uncharacterized protein n=1 Tax=Pseudoloma neurophilia TaxID=146866 RepID=A0A0R0M626_9MICR|nr:hypothetical protein M153_2790006779 [Pseudoloma neurophilia]
MKYFLSFSQWAPSFKKMSINFQPLDEEIIENQKIIEKSMRKIRFDFPETSDIPKYTDRYNKGKNFEKFYESIAITEILPEELGDIGDIQQNFETNYDDLITVPEETEILSDESDASLHEPAF